MGGRAWATATLRRISASSPMRCCATCGFISAIGLHTQGMTLKQSEQMFRDSAFQDPGNARQQAARGTYDPAYLNYTLGKLMIRKLREDWVAQKHAGQDPRAALARVPRQVPVLRRPADSAGAQGDGGRGRLAVLKLHSWNVNGIRAV